MDAVNSQGTKLLGFDAKNSGMEGSYLGSFCLLGLRRNYTSHKMDFLELGVNTTILSLPEVQKP